MTIDTRTLKIQQNKGKPRIWLEGSYLDAARFVARAAYTKDIGASVITLKLDPNGTRNVSGKDITPTYRKPVIDLHENALIAWISDATHVDVTLDSDKGVIAIRRTPAVTR